MPSRPLSFRTLSLRLFPFALALSVLLTAEKAHAQFTNKSIGFEAGYFLLDEQKLKIGSGPVVGLDATLYIDAGFELYTRVVAGIHKDLIGNLNTIGMFPALGVRYLFSEDTLRPYVGLNLAFMHFFGSDNLPLAPRFTISPQGGLEYFFSDNTSITGQLEYHRIVELNGIGGNALALMARIGWGF